MDALTKGNQPPSFRKMLSCFSFKHNEKGKQLTCSGTGYPVSFLLVLQCWLDCMRSQKSLGMHWSILDNCTSSHGNCRLA